jgi:hypothetical protein
MNLLHVEVRGLNARKIARRASPAAAEAAAAPAAAAPATVVEAPAAAAPATAVVEGQDGQVPPWPRAPKTGLDLARPGWNSWAGLDSAGPGSAGLDCDLDWTGLDCAGLGSTGLGSIVLAHGRGARLDRRGLPRRQARLLSGLRLLERAPRAAFQELREASASLGFRRPRGRSMLYTS